MERIGDILGRTAGGIPTRNTSNSSKDEDASLIGRARAAPTPCPICHGTGYVRFDVPLDHPDFGKAFPCECQQANRLTRRLDSVRRISNMDAMGRYTFDTFKPDGEGLNEERRKSLNMAFLVARQYALDPQGWLVFLGGYGCGKTHLAAAIANERLERGQHALFVVVPDLLDHLRSAYAPSSLTTYDERFEQVRNAPLLILDDLGTQNATEWAREKLFQIFNHRYNMRLPTVVTSNQGIESIDPRIRSRLHDPEMVRVITIQAPDFRSPGTGHAQDEISSLGLHNDQTLQSFKLRRDELTADQAANLERVVTVATNYAANPVDWLMLTGGYGCGKTHLAAAIANAQVQAGRSALFVVVPDLLDHLRATYSPDSPVSYDKRLDLVRSAPLLVLDDLGTQSATPWAQEKLYQILNHRYNARLPTVITVVDGAQVDERLKTRVFDRGRCTVLRIEAPGYGGTGGRPRQRRARKPPGGSRTDF